MGTSIDVASADIEKRLVELYATRRDEISSTRPEIAGDVSVLRLLDVALWQHGNKARTAEPSPTAPPRHARCSMTAWPDASQGLGAIGIQRTSRDVEHGTVAPAASAILNHHSRPSLRSGWVLRPHLPRGIPLFHNETFTFRNETGTFSSIRMRSIRRPR